MQEALKFQRSPRKSNSLEIPLGALQHTDARESDGAPELKVTLERPVSLEARNAPDATDTAPLVVTPADVQVSSEAAADLEARTTSEPGIPADTAEVTETPVADHATETTEQNAALEAEPNESVSTAKAYERTASPVSPKTPLLVIAAVVSLIAAGWSYSALEDARAKLASMTEAKAGVERSLADAKARLAAADKAIADVKAALTASPLAAAPKK